MDWLSAVIGISSVVSGVPMALFPARKRNNAIKAQEARLSELKAGLPERFFEERRAIEAYPPPSSDRKMQFGGIALTIAGLLLLIMAVFPKP